MRQDIREEVSRPFRTSMLRPVRQWLRSGGALLAFTGFLILSACIQSEDGRSLHGGDEFPNEVSALGVSIAVELGDTSAWNVFVDAPDTAMGLYDSLPVRPQPVPESRKSLLGGLLDGVLGVDKLVEALLDPVREIIRVLRTGAETVLYLVLYDADGDGWVFDPQKEKNLVDVVHLEDDEGSGDRNALYYRLAAFVDQSRNYPVRYRRVQETPAGETEVVALGGDSLPDFAPRDTGYVRVTFESSLPTDSLVRSESLYRVLLADSAGRFGDNRLLHVDRKKMFRRGE
jgi:hypothetical protein